MIRNGKDIGWETASKYVQGVRGIEVGVAWRMNTRVGPVVDFNVISLLSHVPARVFVSQL